ncbi:MAG TPA: NAD(P)-dependent oxidoreductase [Stellaceae bacterium]|jgi:precorrin-2 dehydrogenase/sirohydrochlorin ferrochelatase|nr:NAD(P)-dependent oxidoreductase [Stellaceae bacterium]
MLPLVVDLTRLKVLLVGESAAALRRLELLDEAGARDLAVHAEHPLPALARRAGGRLRRRLPSNAELAAARLVFISDRNAETTPRLAETARAAGALVHVEDAPERSDLHAPAVLRRGALTIAVSTGGASPGLAVQVKHFLGRLFGPEWAERLESLAAMRREWRRSGADAVTVAERTERWIARRPWLPQDREKAPCGGGGRAGPERFDARH